MDNKKKNILTVVAVVAMLLVAAGIIISRTGLPKISLDSGYEERKEYRDEAQRDILGEWTSPDNPDYIIDVWRDGDGGFHALVNLSEQAGEVYFWEMDGSWQDSVGGMAYSSGKKTRVTYDEEENPTTEEIYTDGSGSIYKKGDELVWDDNKETVDDGITFIYSGEY